MATKRSNIDLELLQSKIDLYNNQWPTEYYREQPELGMIPDLPRDWDTRSYHLVFGNPLQVRDYFEMHQLKRSHPQVDEITSARELSYFNSKIIWAKRFQWSHERLTLHFLSNLYVAWGDLRRHHRSSLDRLITMAISSHLESGNEIDVTTGEPAILNRYNVRHTKMYDVLASANFHRTPRTYLSMDLP